MNADYEGLIDYMKGLGAVPLVVIYAKDETPIKLDFLTTPAYDDADSTLKADIKLAVERVGKEL